MNMVVRIDKAEKSHVAAAPTQKLNRSLFIEIKKISGKSQWISSRKML